MRLHLGETPKDDLIIATLWEVKEAIDKDMKVYMGQKPYWARIPEDERHWYMADPYDFLGTTDWEILSKLDEEEMKKEVEVHALL